MKKFLLLIGLTILISFNLIAYESNLPKCDIKNNKPTNSKPCYGEVSYSNGTSYVGEFNLKKKEGKGIFTALNGIYEGQFKKGLYHGDGVLFFPKNAKEIKIEGQLLHKISQEKQLKIFHGWNKILPEKFVGNFKQGVINGSGIFYIKDTENNIVELNGTWDCSSPYGASNYCKLKNYVDNEIYISELPKCEIVDQKVITETACYGAYTLIKGDKYVGEFKDGVFNGQATYTWRNGDKYVGEFKDDKKHGQGTYTSAKGDKYVGEFKDGKQHGHGTYTWAVGNKYVGEFKDGSLNGQGTYTYADGRIQSGDWKNGELVKESDTTKVVKLEPKNNTTFCKKLNGEIYETNMFYREGSSAKGFCRSTEMVVLEPDSTKITKTTTTKEKIVQTVIVESDTTGPQIIVAKTFQANQDMTAVIRGQVKDESEIAQVSIGGYLVSVQNGSFIKQLFVKPEGQTVEIVSMDVHGNTSSTTVQLKRSSVQVAPVKFDPLDPRKIKSKINNNAVALIIGIEDYENTFTAMYAKQDALFFNDFAHQAFGVPRYNIKLLTNASAKRNDTLKIMATWLPKIIKENKTDFYLFFSGHGLASEDGKDLFLLPYDGYPELLEDSTLFRNRIFQDIAKLNPRSVTVFLDTCYSGATRSEEFLVAAKPIFIEVAEQEIPDNFTVFSASSGKETAKVLEEAEHGLFSYFLMKGLEGEADKNNDQQITNGELHSFINKQVSRQANQTPQLAGDADRILVQW